jgi:hydroxyethylthiazole kinase-like uncharacterized protein yjeF
MRVLNAEEMREVDRRAIEELGMPGMVLMENAAIGVADALGERFPRVRRVAIVCGPGNNGGDGFALARHLDARGYALDVFLLDLGRRPRGDAGLQLAILERIPLPVAELGELAAACARADLIVDALFGTGLGRPLEGHAADVLSVLAAAGRPILAVDLPSGLDAGRTEPIGPSLEAALTVTFAAPKVAHVLGAAAARCGEVVVADLGIPAELVEQAPGNWHLSTLEETAALVPLRPLDGHKGTFGHVVVAGGSAGKAGAVVLAARGALRSGAGLVTAAVPAGLASVVDGASLESMTLALPTLALPGGDALSEEATSLLMAFAAGKDAAVLGPGLGRSPAAVALVRALAPALGVPLVLDADGLYALDGELELLAERRAATVLTPHPGEMARLLGMETAAVQADRPAAALTAARRSGAVVVLKGATTLIASPEGELWINPTGGPLLATGGTGDVLAGMVAAWLAQGFEPLAAARLAVYAHGLAGEQLAAARGPFGVVAAEVAETLPAVWRRLADAAEPAEQGA